MEAVNCSRDRFVRERQCQPGVSEEISDFPDRVQISARIGTIDFEGKGKIDLRGEARQYTSRREQRFSITRT
jgi:hypothetical protein